MKHIQKMKSLARNYIWWPKMDEAIEDTVKHCQACQESRPSPPAAPLHPWEWPSEPWSRLHLDFAGPYLGAMYLILVDAHSKWMDVQLLQSISSAKTIQKLRTIFATHGIPRKIVTDNGPSFTSSEFAQFMKANGISHIKSAPYHPSTNGLAERAVQTFKQGVAKISGDTVQERISKFLFKYHIPSLVLRHHSCSTDAGSDVDLTIGILTSHNVLRIGNCNRNNPMIHQHLYVRSLTVTWCMQRILWAHLLSGCQGQ